MVMSPDNGDKNYVIVGMVSSDTKDVVPEQEHLVSLTVVLNVNILVISLFLSFSFFKIQACFIAGSLAMGSKYFGRPDDLELAKKITEGCYLSYNKSTTGLAPEFMKFTRSSASKTFSVDPNTFYNRFYTLSSYILRPGKYQ